MTTLAQQLPDDKCPRQTTTSETGRTQIRLHSLDALRGLAASLVLFVHYDNPDGPIAGYSGIPGFDVQISAFGHSFTVLGQATYFGLDASLQVGYLSVQLFFVLSGFIFMYIYYDRLSNRRVSVGDFAVARFSRLFPLAWMATLAMIPLILLAGNHTRINLWSIVQNVLILGGFEGLDQPIGAALYNVPLWSLTAELWAYALFVIVCRSTKSKYWFAAPIIVAMLVMQLDLHTISVLSPNFLRVFVGFFMGCLTYLLVQQPRSTKMNRLLGWTSLATFTAISISALLTHHQIDGNTGFVFSTVAFPALLVAVLCVGWLRYVLSTRFFRWLGNLSFGIYLWHWPVFTLVAVLYAHGVRLPLQSSKFMVLTFAIVVLVSHFSYYYVEKPLQALIRRRYAKSKGAAMGPETNG